MSKFIPAHKNFRVIAIAAPVPPYTGYPLDPPFRSRFQARFVDPLRSSLALHTPSSASHAFVAKLSEIILSIQLSSETSSSRPLSTTLFLSKPALSPFPQTALTKLNALFATFPPGEVVSPAQLTTLLLAIHPQLVCAPAQAWVLLKRLVGEAGLGHLITPSSSDSPPQGLLGYVIGAIDRVGERTARVTFSHSLQALSPVSVNVPAGPNTLFPFPFPSDTSRLGFIPSPRFMGQLTCLLQAHALGWDISFLPPAVPAATASTSTGTLVRVFGQLLGYASGVAQVQKASVIHLYKEVGGREVMMRRKVDDNGATSWEPR